MHRPDGGNKMKLTMKKLETWRACTVGKEWFAGQAETDGKKIVETLITEKHLNWASWLVVRLLTRADKIRYAIYAAEQVIDIYERTYPDDKRPREAIEAAKTYLNNPTEANKRAAADAAAAANAAAYAYAAYAAADAAAAYAAAAAAYAAAANAAAAYAADAYAAYAAAADAAAAAMKEKIIRYGLTLVKKEGIK